MRLAASNDRRETISPIMAVASEAADPLAIPAHHQPIAVMLDSWTHSGPDGGRATLDGRHGSTNPGDVFLRDIGGNTSPARIIAAYLRQPVADDVRHGSISRIGMRVILLRLVTSPPCAWLPPPSLFRFALPVSANSRT
jgi:hypothetical protein